MLIKPFFNNDLDKRRSITDVVTQVLLVESEAIRSVIKVSQESLAEAVIAIFESRGQLIVAGLGKSGHIARKIASTFCSLGKSSVFLHAAEASHGDLGIIHDQSVVLVLSNSGETTELSDLLAYCADFAVPVISITTSATSTLGKASTIVIAHGQITEACMNGLAPTTSTTVALALGDALGVGVSHLFDVKPQDFRRYHPGGKLGSRLLKASELMRKGETLPIVSPTTSMQEVVIEMSKKSLGTAIVCEGSKVIGVITDGDMRRNIENLWQSSAADLIMGPPKSIEPHTLAVDALNFMNTEKITSVIVTSNNGDLLGLIHMHDCLHAEAIV